RKVNQPVVSRDSYAAYLILPRVKKRLHPLRNYVGKVRLAFMLEDKATAVRQPHRVRVDVGQLFVFAFGERVVAYARRGDTETSGELFPVKRPVPRDETQPASRGQREFLRLLRRRLIRVDDEVPAVTPKEYLLAVGRPDGKPGPPLAVEGVLAQVSAVRVHSPNFVVPTSVRREHYATSVG